MAWFQTVSNAVYQALCATFGVSPESEAGMKRFVPAYLFQATTPQADRNVNVCYYDIRQASDEGLNYTELQYAAKTAQAALATVERNMPLTVLFTFYGPNADDDSETFWTMIQTDLDSTSPRSVFRRNHIVINGRPEFPVGLDEIEGTFIRRRCDVRVNLVYYDTKSKLYNTVEVPPDFQDDGTGKSGIFVQY